MELPGPIRRPILVWGVLLAASLGVAAADGDPPVATTVYAARVTYITGSSVYINVGQDHGVREGDSLSVVRDDETVAHLRVIHLSATRASCLAVEADNDLVVGDLVLLAGRDVPSADAARTAGEAIPESTGGSVPAPTSAEESVDTAGLPGLARISNVDQSRVFIDSGENKGLRGGDELRVVRANTTVAVLEVTDVGTDRAACKLVDGAGNLDVGDLVRLPIRVDGADTGPVPDYNPQETIVVARPTPPGAQGRAGMGGPRGRVGGRVGLRYLFVRDYDTEAGDLSQPALDLRLDGTNLAGGHLDLAADVRSRRTYRSEIVGGQSAEDQTRVYRLALAVHDRRSRFRLALGRQFSPSLAGVSTFDGALAAYHGMRVSTGLFGGTQPDPVTYGYSGDVTEYGAFVQLHNRPEAPMQWSVTSGAIGSYQAGTVNREYAYLQGLVTSRRVSVYVTQEVDYNRDWKVLAGEDQVEPTSTYAHFGLRVGKGLNLRAGYDNRRNIRLYRDLITPETDFDDSFRQGVWVGFTQRVARRFRFGLSAKNNTSEAAGDANSYTLLLGANRLAKRLSFYYRGTYYTNEITQGALQSLTASIAATRQFRVGMIGGMREDTILLEPDTDQRIVWYGLNMDFNIGRHWFLQLSGERTTGELESTDQGFFGMTYRF